MDLAKISKRISNILVGLGLGLVFFLVQMSFKYFLHLLGKWKIWYGIAFLLHLINSAVILLFFTMAVHALRKRREATFVANAVAFVAGIFSIWYLWIAN